MARDRIVKVNDGTLHAECTYCFGTGKETIWKSSSNYPNAATGYRTNEFCIHCDGNGYERGFLEIVDVKDFNISPKKARKNVFKKKTKKKNR